MEVTKKSAKREGNMFAISHRVEITKICSHAFWQKIRESNAFTK